VSVVSFGARYLGERGDLASPGPGFLAVREDDVAGRHGRLHDGTSGAVSWGRMRE